MVFIVLALVGPGVAELPMPPGNEDVPNPVGAVVVGAAGVLDVALPKPPNGVDGA